MRALLCLSIVLHSSAAFAITPESSRAVILAARTGDAIGGASVCGVPEDRLASAGRRAAGQVRDLATSGAELARAQATHERAIRSGADRVARDGPDSCRTAIDRFRQMELGR